jgi:hypothetical protein
MYPVDLLKVRNFSRLRMTICGRSADLREDQNPDHQPLAGRHVQRHIERHGHNLARGGLHDIMERIVQCRHGSRLVHSALACGDTALTVMQDPRTPSTLRPTKPRNMLLAEMRVAPKSTILLQQVRRLNDIITCTCR